MKVCQKCGDKGDVKLLIYCEQCGVSAEHSYCLDVLPEGGDEKIVWKCEECIPKDSKIGPVPPRKSERITQVAEVKLNRMKMRKQSSFAKVKTWVHVDRLPEAMQAPNEEVKKISSCHQSLGNQELRKQKRWLILEDGESSEEEHEPIEQQASQLALAVHEDQSNISSALGCFWFNNVKNQTSVGLVAHLSSKACPKASDAATSLPPSLDVQILPRSDVWPRNFQISPPNDDSIALYIFPEYESDEKVFDGLMDVIIDYNLALKAVIKNVELLVFCSRELPTEHWRFCSKYYLWGVFKSPSGSECATISKQANDVGIQVERDLVMTGSSQESA